jgi:hypothetical protein
VSVASGGGGAVGGGSGGAVGGGGGVGVGSWPAVGEAADGEEDVILVAKRGGGARGRGAVVLGDGVAAVHGRRGDALAEAGGSPRGEGAGPSRTTVGRSWRSAEHS